MSFSAIREEWAVFAHDGEAWRERHMDAVFEHYMVERKKAEMALVQTGLDLLVLRPAALKDDAGTGRVDLGLAKVHTEITRDDVAATLVELLRAPDLEVSEGNVAIGQAVKVLRSL